MLPLHPQCPNAHRFQPHTGLPERATWIGLRLLALLGALSISLGAAAESPFQTPAWAKQGPVAYGQLRFFSDLDTTLNRVCQQEWGQGMRVVGEPRPLCEHPPAFPLNSAQHMFNKTAAELNGFERAALAQSLRRAMRSAQTGIGGARYYQQAVTLSLQGIVHHGQAFVLTLEFAEHNAMLRQWVIDDLHSHAHCLQSRGQSLCEFPPVLMRIQLRPARQDDLGQDALRQLREGIKRKYGASHASGSSRATLRPAGMRITLSERGVHYAPDAQHPIALHLRDNQAAYRALINSEPTQTGSTPSL